MAACEFCVKFICFDAACANYQYHLIIRSWLILVTPCLEMNYLSNGDEEDRRIKLVQQHMRTKQRLGAVACMIGTYYYTTFMNKSKRRNSEMTSYDWVMKTLRDPREIWRSITEFVQVITRQYKTKRSRI